jgi:hypothetical protein
MKRVKKSFQKGILIIIIIMIVVVPNLKVYASMGSYSASSSILIINENNPTDPGNARIGWPAAIALGVVTGIFFVIGVVDGYNLIFSPAPIVVNFPSK